ncbi:sulfite exporter TauE/SafE family protein [Colwellia sp. RE-S-Sl-9]
MAKKNTFPASWYYAYTISLMTDLIIISLGCFVAAFINASFATGGVYIMLATVSAVLPLTVTIPLLPALALPSLFARIVLFKDHINPSIVKAFIFGSIFGVLLGGQIFVSLDEHIISLSIGGLILLITWWPSISIKLPRFNVFSYIGFSHSFIGTLFGVGGILQPAIFRTAMTQAQITGTLAACLFTMDIFKISSYVFNGFSYFSYTLQLLSAIFFGFLGAWIGKRTSVAISRKTFRRIFKFIITMVALRLIFKGIIY